MTSEREEHAKQKFKCSTKERALFEAGIKMGTIYHQFVGTPVSIDSVSNLETSIETGVLVQPYVESVKVNIDKSFFCAKKDEYSYCSLTGEMLDVILTIKIDNVRITAEMRYDSEINYPLMYISNIQES